MDREKFKKKLKALGMTKLSEKFERKEKAMKNLPIISTKEK
jgi:hypothetical protein